MKYFAFALTLAVIVSVASAHMFLTGVGSATMPTGTVGLRENGNIGGGDPKGGNQVKCGGAGQTVSPTRYSAAATAKVWVAGTVRVAHGTSVVQFTGAAGTNPNFATATTAFVANSTSISTDGTNFNVEGTIPATITSGSYVIQAAWAPNGGYYQCVDGAVTGGGSAATGVAPSAIVAAVVAVVAFVATMF